MEAFSDEGEKQPQAHIVEWIQEEPGPKEQVFQGIVPIEDGPYE